jgi:thiol:disulfide interchange protein
MLDLVVGIALIAVGALLGAFRADLSSLDLRHRLWKAVTVLVVASGLALALGLVDLPGVGAPASPLAWRTDVETALADAKANGRMALLDGGAEWCGACKELEHVTFADPRVTAALADWVVIRLDMTDFDPAQKRLADLGITVGALPWVGFFLPDGRLNPGAVLTDFEKPGPFLRRIEDARTFREKSVGPVEAWIAEKGLFIALLLVFAAGVGVSLTPCVYPMIPITLGVLGAGGRPGEAPPSFGRRVLRAGVFVSGMVVTYAILGVASALLGKGFGSWLQHPVVTLGMALLFAAMAASYLGFFRVDLPEGLKSRMGKRRGGLLGIALVGGTTGLLAAPCAGPVVVGILALVSGTGDLGLGLLLMLAFGLGMGLLFFVLGVSTALVSLRPRSGGWMERVEIFFALALLVVSIYYARLGLGL